MSERPNLIRDDARVGKVLATRAARTPNPVATVAHIEGAHVWAASGLVGWPGGSPVNTWAQSGLHDAFANFRTNQPSPTDWVTTVATAMKKER